MAFGSWTLSQSKSPLILPAHFLLWPLLGGPRYFKMELTYLRRHGLVQNIYRHTSPGDKLRKFCASCLVYSFIRGGDDSINEGVEKLLKDDSGILRDFLVTLRDFGGHSHDPRFSEEGDQIKQQSVEG